MAELKVGDQVFDEQGVPCNVVAKSPVWHDRPIYRVNTDDGDSILADENHEWVVSKAKHRDAFFVADTAYVSESRTKRLMVRKQGSLQLPEASLPVDPYVLGVWLGDGCSQHATITQSDEDINWLRDQFANCGYTTTDRATHNTFGVLGLQVQLKGLGVINNKHIPLGYLRASESQRTALLQGLLDTDGHVSPDGQTEFCTTSLALAEGCLELVRSLGTKASLICGRAMLNSRDCGPKYRVMFYKAGACRLPRKAKRCRDGVKQANRYIDATYVGTGDTVCIEVDSPSHMFLCGRSMLPTHNSEFISKYFPAWTLGNNPDDSMILASYAETFATEWGGKVRDLLEEYGERFFGIKLKDDRKAAGLWNIDRRSGGMFTAGVGGQITGRGARTFIIDDPFKNMEEANSETIRAKNMEWYRSAVYSRLTPDGAIIIIATRWHEADITGTVLQEMTEGGDQWAYLHLPTLHESNEVWADLTIPGEQAERIKAHEGMTFNQLDDFLTHCALHAA